MQMEEDHDPLLSQIDKVILVAVPQAGSPETISSILHGEDLGTQGITMTAQTERSLALTFPSMYQILPNDSLLRSISTSGIDPIHFTTKSSSVATGSPSDYSKQISKYGNSIQSATSLYSYVRGAEGRVVPDPSDLYRPAVGYKNMMDYASIRKAKLDSYVPTSTIAVTQIAGYGIPTILGYDYGYTVGCVEYMASTSTSPLLPTPLICKHSASSPRHNMTLSVNGDGTVPVPSALWMDTASHANVRSLWVDLKQYNKDYAYSLSLRKEHKNILAVPDLVSQLSHLIQGYSLVTENYIHLSPISSPSTGYITIH